MSLSHPLQDWRISSLISGSFKSWILGGCLLMQEQDSSPVVMTFPVHCHTWLEVQAALWSPGEAPRAPGLAQGSAKATEVKISKQHWEYQHRNILAHWALFSCYFFERPFLLRAHVQYSVNNNKDYGMILTHSDLSDPNKCLPCCCRQI